ncbi:RNA polymerase sigma factor [Sphingobacterium paludis]|jgi:RNA polymerase sigma factor (sigma-70 family)|uniref:RNA polymerase sigma-70 factor (ECF subfamily) n=1 Tax=Sphingobacterium paludis TaxID=1476465 RepID=A0A4R7CWS4_9SPHI|nr:RNA polymerase sigma factor [Sphingobacterium paludis]TDS12949.1 RNA polymerase sigma-70 factor (ECF subfamily) [Sphingobacterium paludis]
MNSLQLNRQIEDSRSILTNFAYKFTSDPDDVEDLVQETLIKSVKYADEYTNNPKLLSWLYVIMKNLYINNYRRKQKRSQYENAQIAELRDQGCTEPFARNNVEGKFTMGDIQFAMSKLSSENYEIFSMYVDGFKYKELAEHFDMPEGTIKTRIHHSKKILQKHLATYKKSA